MMIKRYFSLAIAVLLCSFSAIYASKALKPRIIVLTDIAPGNVEPDDMESMVRLLAYTDVLEIEAIITSTGWNCDPYPDGWADSLQRVIDAYEHDVPNLMKRSNQRGFLPLAEEKGKQTIGYWVSPTYLRSRAVMGSRRSGIAVIGEGNRNPVVIVNGKKGTEPILIKQKTGKTVKLDASHSFDPDGHHLSFRWWVQKDIGYAGEIALLQENAKAYFTLPSDMKDKEIHIICEVRDDGEIPLASYRRIIISSR